jgi:hypothetical protein
LGYYSPDVYEGYVGKPVFEITVGLSLDYWSTVLGVAKVKAHHQLNLLKLTVGF